MRANACSSSIEGGSATMVRAGLKRGHAIDSGGSRYWVSDEGRM